MSYSDYIGWTPSKMKIVRRSAEGVLDGSMIATEKPSASYRPSAMELVLQRRSTSFRPGDHVNRNKSAIPNVANFRCAYVQRLWARLLGVLGSFPLILGWERVRIWVIDRFEAQKWFIQIGLSIATSLSSTRD